jgi:glycosyltransferase involved in cell wall biosynthesis
LSEKKNTLFISYDGMTDPLGQSQVIPYLSGVAGSGLYHIFILSCEKKDAYIKNKALVEDLLQGKNITWVPLFYTKKPPVLSTLYDVVKLRKAATRIHRKNKLSLVHTRPGVPALIGLWLKKKYNIAFLNDVREFYADSRVDGGMWDPGKPLYKKIYNYFKAQEAEQIKLSDGIVCLTSAAENIIKSWPEYDPKVRVEMIPCSVDLTLFDASFYTASQKDIKAKELGIVEGDMVVSYLGSIGGWYMTGEMLKFCKILSDKYPAAKFLFISPHQHGLIKKTATSHGIPESKIIIVKAARKEVPLLLSLSAFSVFFIKPCYSKLSSSPTKHGEIMGMGIPVITNSGVGDVEEIIEKYNSGIVIQYFTTEEMNQAANAVAEKEFNKDDIRRGALEFYSLDNAVRKYRDMYAHILTSK